VKSIAIVAVLTACVNNSAFAETQNPGNKPEEQYLIPSLDGAALFAAYCASCHGKAADGHGPVAPILKVRVPDLTTITKRNGGVFPFTHVEKTIDGKESAGLAHGTREMPIWGPIFSQVTSDKDFGKVRIYNLAKYLMTLRK
jgi:mono/diheme cytochrome c family protein